VRTRLVRILLTACLLSVTLPVVVLAKPRPQQVCGIVVSVECSRYRPNTPAVMTLLVQPGIAVDVEATTEADAQTLRSAAWTFFLQRACVTGTLTAKQNQRRAGQLVVDATAVVAANGPGPADWPATDLHSSCEADIIGPRLKSRPPQPPPHEALVNGVQGTAIFQIIVAADGTVENLRLVKSLDVIYGTDRFAAAFVGGMTFEPATKSGVPVRFSMLYTYSLSLAP
jgi:TonB family protein